MGTARRKKTEPVADNYTRIEKVEEPCRVVTIEYVFKAPRSSSDRDTIDSLLQALELLHQYGAAEIVKDDLIAEDFHTAYAILRKRAQDDAGMVV